VTVTPGDGGQRPLTVDMASFERLIRVETKLDTVIESKTSDHAELVKDIADHESRLRLLERMWWKTAGVASAVGALVAVGAGLVARLVGE